VLAAALSLFLAAALPAAGDKAIRKELCEAAAANDLPRFDAVLERARDYVETMPLGARRNRFRRAVLAGGDISKVWHFAVTDEHGLYYDDERFPFFYDHLAADYPGYARFIREYRVLDRSGLPLYPTRETRDFLLKSLENTGRSSP
jgi:hypothetical protein